MRLTVASEDGTPLDFECADTIVSGWLCTEILRGRTYPFLPFVEDVRVVMDVGANCGATSVHFAHHYPGAQIHAFEPGSEPRAILERNARSWRNITVHPFGLHDADQHLPLYKGDGDTGLGSLLPRAVNLPESEQVELRRGASWATSLGIGRVDVIKVDVEGAEVPVVEGLAHLVAEAKVIYLEYDSRGSRRALDHLLEASHELYTGMIFLDQGELVYLRKDIAQQDAASAHLAELLHRRLREGGDKSPA